MFKCFNLRFVLKYHTDWQRNAPIIPFSHSLPLFHSMRPTRFYCWCPSFHSLLFHGYWPSLYSIFPLPPSSPLVPFLQFPSIPRLLIIVPFPRPLPHVLSPCSVPSNPFYSMVAIHLSIPPFLPPFSYRVPFLPFLFIPRLLCIISFPRSRTPFSFFLFPRFLPLFHPSAVISKEKKWSK